MGPIVVLRLTPVWYAVLLQALDQAAYVSTPWLPKNNLEVITNMIYEQGGTKRIVEPPRPPAPKKERQRIFGIF